MDPVITLLRDLVAIDSVNPSLVPGAAGEGAIAGALHIPRGHLESQIENRIPDKRTPVVVYCAGGTRSAFAAKTMQELGYETVVVDGRAAFATEARFPDVDRLVVGWPDEVADAIGLGPADAVAVLTHDVKFDEPAIVEALRRGCRYVGAVGSRKTQADRRARLLAAGVGEAELARLRGPIGLDLGGRAPAETALAIMAEVVAARYAGSGAPMRERVAAG